MGSLILTALPQTTADGRVIFGQNIGDLIAHSHGLHLEPGKEFSPGETVTINGLSISQVRQTLRVLATREGRSWGYCNGINECGLCVGYLVWNTNWGAAANFLGGGDLVRLALERCRTARQATDLVTGLIERHGQVGAWEGGHAVGDSALLIADADEAFCLETAGRHWAVQEIQQIRAVSNVGMIHQDWNRISHGCADAIIDRGLWPADGSKVDFAGTLASSPVGQDSGLRRWGRATIMMEQQNGRIDLEFVRRILSDHYEGTRFEFDPSAAASQPVSICQHSSDLRREGTVSSMISECCNPESARLSLFWYALGQPCSTVYVPLCSEGELPASLLEAPARRRVWLHVGDSQLPPHTYHPQDAAQQPGDMAEVREKLGQLQFQLDSEAEHFACEGSHLKQSGSVSELRNVATAFMEACVARCEKAAQEIRALSIEESIPTRL
jgi:secernin